MNPKKQLKKLKKALDKRREELESAIQKHNEFRDRHVKEIINPEYAGKYFMKWDQDDFGNRGDIYSYAIEAVSKESVRVNQFVIQPSDRIPDGNNITVLYKVRLSESTSIKHWLGDEITKEEFDKALAIFKAQTLDAIGMVTENIPIIKTWNSPI